MNVEQRLFDMVSQCEFLQDVYDVEVLDIPDDLQPEDAVIIITRKTQ